MNELLAAVLQVSELIENAPTKELEIWTHGTKLTDEQQQQFAQVMLVISETQFYSMLLKAEK